MDVMGRVACATTPSGWWSPASTTTLARLCWLPKATAKPVCRALTEATRRHGILASVLTDNGKVFTGRFGVTKPRSSSTASGRRTACATCSPPRTRRRRARWNGCTGPMRAEFFSLGLHHRGAPSRLRPLGAPPQHRAAPPRHPRRPPDRRFALRPAGTAGAGGGARRRRRPGAEDAGLGAPPATRVVGRTVASTLSRHRYAVGRCLAGETVEIVCGDALVEIRRLQGAESWLPGTLTVSS
jgi:hypothetical protein